MIERLRPILGNAPPSHAATPHRSSLSPGPAAFLLPLPLPHLNTAPPCCQPSFPTLVCFFFLSHLPSLNTFCFTYFPLHLPYLNSLFIIKRRNLFLPSAVLLLMTKWDSHKRGSKDNDQLCEFSLAAIAVHTPTASLSI